MKNDEEGQILIFTALALTAIIVAMGLVLEAGIWRRDDGRLEQAAEAGALAGANLLPAKTTAQQQAAKTEATTIVNNNLALGGNGGGNTTADSPVVTLSSSQSNGVYDEIKVSVSDTKTGVNSGLFGINLGTHDSPQIASAKVVGVAGRRTQRRS